MLPELIPALGAWLLHGVAIVACRALLRPVIAVLWLTSFYYALLGPAYWLDIQQGAFLGVFFADQIPRAALYVSGSALLFSVSLITLDALFFRHGSASSPGRASAVDQSALPTTLRWNAAARLWRGTLVLGTLCALITLAQVLGGVADAEKLGLIAYQFSDLLIPVLVFAVGARGVDKLTGVLLVLFGIYATIIGFRYKLVLVCFPMVVMYLFPVVGDRKVSVGKASALMALMVVMFSLITLTRGAHLTGIDLQVLSTASNEDVTYGFFAESNTIFGLIGALQEGIDLHHYIHFDPIRDALLELVPRFLMPDRVTGAYLALPLQRLISLEALQSGTAFPYVGELVMMGGHLALVLGTMVLSLVYLTLARLLERLPAAVADVANAGHGLLAVYFGYYYFSRGYFPQTFKAFLFIVCPFILMAVLISEIQHRRPVADRVVGQRKLHVH